MKKFTSFFVLSLAFAFGLLSFSSSLMGDSASSKLEELQAEDSPVEHNTLAAPLFMSDFPPAGLAVGTHSLLREPFMPGTKGDLLFQQLDNGTFRLRYHDLKEEASFFWLFEKGMDLRNRWFRLRYSGIQVPKRVALEFDKDELRNNSKFYVYLEDTLVGDEVFFKLPDNLPFSSIETIRLVIEPGDVVHQNADFVIQDLELLPEKDDPLSGPPSDLERFDWHAKPFEPENQASFNTNYSF